MAAHIAGELSPWLGKLELARLLEDAGLVVTVGEYSIRVRNNSHFVFQNYGGDLGDPTIDASADTIESLTSDARTVSDVLSRAGIRHRLEVYDSNNELLDYLHHE